MNCNVNTMNCNKLQYIAIHRNQVINCNSVVINYNCGVKLIAIHCNKLQKIEYNCNSVVINCNK